MSIGLRERKKIETRARLVAAAVELFSRHGFNGTTVDDIAQRAGVSARTFFHYFPSKEDVLLGDQDERLEGGLAVVRAQPIDATAPAALTAGLRAIAASFDDDGDSLRARYRLVLDERAVRARSLELHATWEERMARELVARFGGTSPELRARALAAAGLSCLRAAAQHWARDDDPEPVVRLLDVALLTLSDTR